MKEATGEFSMTVVTILAVVVIAGLVAFLGPKITEFVETKWDEITGTETGAKPLK